ncbi:MAG: hypothetical protein R3C25_09615 [Hyphomonadaceae bacterium]
MSGAMVQWAAAIMVLAAGAACFGLAVARSLLGATIYLFIAGAAASVAVGLLGKGAAATMLAVVACGWAIVLLLAAMLLTTRLARTSQRRSAPWATLALGIVLLGVLCFPLRELQAAMGVRETPQYFVPWLAPLLLVAVAGCLALLGFGERGVLGGGKDQRR